MLGTADVSMSDQEPSNENSSKVSSYSNDASSLEMKGLGIPEDEEREDNSSSEAEDKENVGPTVNSEDDSDDEFIFRKRMVKRNPLQELDDSESEEDVGVAITTPRQRVKILSESESDDDRGPEKHPSDESDNDDDNTPSSSSQRERSDDNKEEGVSSQENRAGSESDSDEDERQDSRAAVSGEDSDSDEGPQEMSEALRKRLSQGAAKKSKGESGKRDRPRAVKKEALIQIHAETQRIIREAAVRLPYHKPQPLGLAAILARTQKKQAQLQGIKGCSWKTPPSSLLDRIQTSLSSKTPSSEKSKSALLANNGASPNLTKPTETTPGSSEVVVGQITLADNDEFSLPDLDITEKTNVETICNKSTQERELEKDKNSLENTSEKYQVVLKDQAKPEQDSGFLTASSNNSEEENSSEQPVTVHKEQKKDGVPNVLSSPGESVLRKSVLARTLLTPKLASLGVGSSAPRLSCGPDSFIDLDDADSEGATPKPGVHDLMARLVKHSAQRKKKGARDVELSSVQKVKGESEREELQLHKVVVHLEGEEENGPALEKPGAKLLRLKESLATKMRAKREEARLQRCEVYALDNEEGFNDEEEAEMTDQTDTEDECDEEEMEEEEMDEGAEEEEEEERIANPFVDDEAEDEDDDEGSIHLQFDDEDSRPPAELATKPVKDFLKSALQKTNTLQLFDDDAVSQSPTMSQNDKQTNIELSERPFEQLSGETVKVASQKNDEDDDDDLVLMDADISMDCLDDEKSSKAGSVNRSLSLIRDKDVSISSADNSFDMLSLIPAGQGTGCKKRFSDRGRNTPDLFTPSSKSSIATNSTISKSVSKLSDLAMPIEDSQDLLGESPSMQSSQAESTPRNAQRNSFNFHGLDDSTHSNMLDEDGLLKAGSSKKPARRQLVLDIDSSQEEDEILGLCSGKFTTQPGVSKSKGAFEGVGGISQLGQDNDQNMDELLGLCSGQFTGKTQHAGMAPSQRADIPNTQANMDELLGLCSGQFTGGDSLRAFGGTVDSPAGKRSKGKKRRPVIEDDEDDDFGIAAPDQEEDDSEEVNLDSDEEAGDADEEAENSEDDEQPEKPVKFKGFKKKGMLMKDFVEEEAELSGSEYDSDENYDIDEKDDILEACSGDEEELHEEDLRDQVGRVHLKRIIDEDKQEIRLMQEMYLPDGDLYSEGGGRMRRFRWKNIDDDDTQQDMFNASDEEHAEDNLEVEKWRLERHEREKFISEQEKEKDDLDTSGSQVFKLGKALFKQKKDNRPLPKVDNQKPSTQTLDKKQGEPEKAKVFFKVPKAAHGSFLGRSKETLAKIADMTKPVSRNVKGPRNSRNLVFATMTSDEKGIEDKKKPMMRKASSTPSSQPTAKRPRLDRGTSLPVGSIFNHL